MQKAKVQNLTEDFVAADTPGESSFTGRKEGGTWRVNEECCRGRSKAEFIAKPGDCLRELDESLIGLNSSPARNCYQPTYYNLCGMKPTSSSPSSSLL